MVTIRSGGPSTVGVLREVTRGSSPSSMVGIVPLHSGCPRNTRGVVVLSTANEHIPPKGLPSSINYIIVGIASTTFVSHCLGSNGPLMSHSLAISNSTVATPRGIHIPVNARVSCVVGTYNNFHRPPIGVVANKPVVNASVISARRPVLGYGGTVLTFASSSVDLGARATYVRYNEYTGTYPVCLRPAMVRGCTIRGSMGGLLGTNTVIYVRYNSYTCAYPTNGPLIRFVHSTGSVMESRTRGG